MNATIYFQAILVPAQLAKRLQQQMFWEKTGKGRLRHFAG